MAVPIMMQPPSFGLAPYVEGPFNGNQPRYGPTIGTDAELAQLMMRFLQFTKDFERYQPTSWPLSSALDTHPKEAEKPKDTKFPIRVKLCQTDEDCHKTAHEVFRVDAESSFGELRQYLRRQFKGVSKLKSADKVNLKGVCWGDEDRVVKIKAMYSRSNPWDVGGDVVGETTLTEQNCQDTLGILKKWGGHDFLCVVIGAPAGPSFPE